MGEEYRVVSIIVIKRVVNMFVFSLLVFHHLNYANVFYYYAKAILPDDLGDLFQNLDLRRVLIIALMGMHSINILTSWFFTKVESNSSDVFSRVDSQVKYRVAIFFFFIVFVVLILLGSLVVSNNINIVLSCLNSNKFNQFGFLFI